MAYSIRRDESCYEEEDCRVTACKAKIGFGPAKALDDITDVEWWHFQQFIDLLDWNMDVTAATEEYFVVGDCRPRVKVTSCSWTFSGNLYYCKNDLAACRACRPKNCVSICYVPCGEDYTHDVDDSNPDPMEPDTPVFGDPMGAGDAVYLGVGVVNQCSTSGAPPDYIRQSFTIQGVGELYEFNTCESLENYDDDFVPEGQEGFTFNENGILVPASLAA